MSHQVFISKEEIHKKIIELANTISNDFKNEEVVIVGVLNGSFIFVADLVRQLKLSTQIDFISASSYEGDKSTGELKVLKDIKIDIEGKNVILIEDIVDTGLTISLLKKMFLDRKPKILKICSLLHKPARTTHQVSIDYLGFTIEDKFVIGYGLDYDGKFRELPYIGVYSGS